MFSLGCERTIQHAVISLSVVSLLSLLLCPFYLYNHLQCNLAHDIVQFEWDIKHHICFWGYATSLSGRNIRDYSPMAPWLSIPVPKKAILNAVLITDLALKFD